MARMVLRQVISRVPRSDRASQAKISRIAMLRRTSGLFDAGIHVVEHFTGPAIWSTWTSDVSAVPPRVSGFETFPVRAFAVV